MRADPAEEFPVLEQAGKENMKRSPIRKAGKKTKEWQAVWGREIKPMLERMGITSCEVRLGGCLGGIFLTPMHSLKRRNANTPELLREVVVACVHCHQVGEAMKEADMCALVRRVIANRNALQYASE